MLPKFVPNAVGGAAGWVGGLGAFGGFLLPPLMGLLVQHRGGRGYAHGFLVFVALSLTALGLAINLLLASHKRPAAASSPEPAEGQRATL